MFLSFLAMDKGILDSPCYLQGDSAQDEGFSRNASNTATRGYQ